MKREEFYSITQVLKTFKISRFKLQKLVDDKTLQPEVKRLDLGLYLIYFLIFIIIINDYGK